MPIARTNIKRKSEDVRKDFIQKYKCILDNTNNGILILDDKSNIVYMNFTMSDIIGLERYANLKESGYKNLFTPYSLEHIELIKETHPGELSCALQSQIIDDNGNIKTYMHSISSYKITDSNTGYLEVFVDFENTDKTLNNQSHKKETYLKQTEKHTVNIPQSANIPEPRFRRMIEVLGRDYCYYSFDWEGRILYMSPSSEYVFGLEFQQTIGKRLPDLVNWSEKSRNEGRIMVETMAETKRPIKSFLLSFDLNNEKRYVLSWGRPILDEHNNISYIDGFSINVSKYILTHKQLEKSNKMLREQKDKLIATMKELKETQDKLIHSENMASIGTLIAGFTHQINNATNNINSGIIGLRKLYDVLINRLEESRNNESQSYQEISRFIKTELKDDIDILFTCVEGGVQSMKELVTRIKDLSLHNIKNIKYHDINEIICTILSRIKAKDENVELTTNLSSLPGIKANYDLLYQVFYNIITNAFQAIPQGGKVTVSTEFNDNSGEFNITVKDTGNGISEEVKNNLFEPFVSNRGYDTGMGLGLYIAKNIIKLYDGKIIYISNNTGTEFIITIPL